MAGISLEEMLSRLKKDTDKSNSPLCGEDDGKSHEEKASGLRAAFSTYVRQENLKPGDLVIWKEGMRNKRRPLDEELAIIVEIFATPIKIQHAKFAGSAIYHEPINARIAFLDSDGEFMIHGYDLNRFQRYEKT